LELKQQDKITAPYKIYGENFIEPQALAQFYEVMKLESVVQGALLPDAHLGYTMPIGMVCATRNVISPQFVGFDIGCGACALQLPYKRYEIEKYSKEIFDSIYRSIPTGLGGKNTHRRSKPIEDWDYDHLPRSEMLDGVMKNGGLADLASLGSGNHMAEIGYDEDNNVWVSIHSGSRSVGHICATHWMKLASETDKAKDGLFGFDTASEDGILYGMDLEFCLQFALENRKRMMQRIIKEIKHYLKGDKQVDWTKLINRNHNHAEYKIKEDYFIHRKGVTHSEKDMDGIILGNMRDGIAIVKGKGNPDSLNSSSHGAGRVLSRTKAKELLSMDAFENQMKGITAKVEKGTIDESPSSYKDFHKVLKEQEDLINIIHIIKPIINIKAAGGRGNRNRKTKTRKLAIEAARAQEAEAAINDCL
jgi:tRNA-splicing ligase RtcB (3'-phosphate/5'-hydroxy nucleic acid ligase)